MEYDYERPEKIVIGKTWFYVALILLAVILIYAYRCHHEEPKVFREPESN
jgi:hypothetical protein